MWNLFFFKVKGYPSTDLFWCHFRFSIAAAVAYVLYNTINANWFYHILLSFSLSWFKKSILIAWHISSVCLSVSLANQVNKNWHPIIKKWYEPRVVESDVRIIQWKIEMWKSCKPFIFQSSFLCSVTIYQTSRTVFLVEWVSTLFKWWTMKL